MFSHSVSHCVAIHVDRAVPAEVGSGNGYVVSGKIRDFRNDMLGIFVINVEDECLNQVTGYLDAKGMNWMELPHFHGEQDAEHDMEEEQ